MGGIVLDASRFADILDVSHGWITADAGASFVRLEAEARRTGQELAMFPSTTNSCLGGFLGGGAGGTGSIEHGFIWDGYVAALEIVPCVPDTEPSWVEDGHSVSPFLHAYGTTGLITAASVRLAPARQWTALFASFASWGDALEAAWRLINREPRPRNVAVDEAAMVAVLPRHPAIPEGRVSLRAIVVVSDVDDVRKIVNCDGGRVELVRSEATGQLVGLSYNHVTLHALRSRPELCHLQVGGPALANHADEVRACLPGAMIHIDCHQHDGMAWFGGLLLSIFQSAETLESGMAALRRLGVTVVNPHTYQLGGDERLVELRAQAARSDPKGLLNPGKLPPPAAT